MHGEPYKGRRAMKPKYEIDQTVYLKNGQRQTIYGVTKQSIGGFMYHVNECKYPRDEDELYSLPPILNKKYYILYRSADGLEKREMIGADDNLHYAGIGRSRRYYGKSSINRSYMLSGKLEDNEEHTITYIYDEVI